MPIAGTGVLVTGGSSGIGSATAQALGAQGARLLLAARRPRADPADPRRLARPAAQRRGMVLNVTGGSAFSGDGRTAMAKLNQENPGAVDRRFLAVKVRLEGAVRDHVAL